MDLRCRLPACGHTGSGELMEQWHQHCQLYLSKHDGDSAWQFPGHAEAACILALHAISFQVADTPTCGNEMGKTDRIAQISCTMTQNTANKDKHIALHQMALKTKGGPLKNYPIPIFVTCRVIKINALAQTLLADYFTTTRQLSRWPTCILQYFTCS